MKVAVDGSAGLLDGAAVAAWAWVPVDSDGVACGPVAVDWGYGVDAYASELAAVAAAVAAAPVDAGLTVLSDCASAVKVLRAMSRYAAQGWRKRPAGTAAVARADLLAPLHAQVAARTGRTRFDWVRGHADHHGNHACDLAARARLRAVVAASRNGAATAV